MISVIDYSPFGYSPWQKFSFEHVRDCAPNVDAVHEERRDSFSGAASAAMLPNLVWPRNPLALEKFYGTHNKIAIHETNK